MADGWITIETKLSTSKFDKQVAKLDEKIQKKEKEKIKLETDIENIKESEAEYDELIKKSGEYGDKIIEAKNKVEQLKAARHDLFKEGTNEIDAKDYPKYEEYSAQIKEAEQNVRSLNAEQAQTTKEIEKWDTKLINNANKIERIREKQSEITEEVKKYKNEIESVKLQKQQAQVDSIKNNFEGVSKSVGKAIGRVARLALGVISIASAYRFVSQASSTLGQYDEQYATNLEYIRYLIAQTIAPALKYVVNLASTLLSYLNYILNAWFGITLFSKNSAKNFMNAKNSTGGISKNTGKIKKDLQTTPFDEMNILSDTSDSGTSGGGAGGAVAPSIDPSMLAGAVPDWIQFIVDHKDEILAVMAGVAAGLLAWQMGLSAIKALGIGIMLAGILYTIESLLDYLKDPSWENFGKIIQGIGATILGLGILIGNVPLIVIGAIVLIVGTIIKYWEQIKAFLQNGIDWLKGKSDWIRKMFGDTIGDIYDYLVETLQHILDVFDSLFSSLKKIFDDIIKIVKDIIRGDWKQAWEDAKQLVVDVFQGIWDTAKNVFFAVASFGASIATAIGGAISGIFKAVVNAALWAIENILNKPINTINSLAGVVNPIIGTVGLHIPTMQTFKLPRLKVGGIINMPGRGIPVGGGMAVGGEAGREGVIPLTDTQAMETLGEAIGRYITINASITNTMNGRVLSRQIQQITNERNFAYNG